MQFLVVIFFLLIIFLLFNVISKQKQNNIADEIDKPVDIKRNKKTYI